MTKFLARTLCRYGLSAWFAAVHAACGVYMGEPIRLFPEHGKDAGAVPASEACVLDRQQVSGNVETVVGATGAELSQLATANYDTPMIWNRGKLSRLHVTLSNVVIYSVTATRNVDYDRWGSTPPCQDHATIEATVALKTDDGQLDEQIDHVTLVAYDDFEAHGSFAIEKAALHGTYAGPAGLCLQELRVRLLLARDGSHGSMGDYVRDALCDDTRDRPEEELATAHWGARWANYGE